MLRRKERERRERKKRKKCKYDDTQKIGKILILSYPAKRTRKSLYL